MGETTARTVVYVDGLNLYYGSLRGTKYRWLNLAELFRILLPQNQVERVKYFTAKVKGRGRDSGPPIRQDTYLRALRTLPEVEAVFGHFQVTQPWMRTAEPEESGARWVRVIKTEEKGSDVNLAAHCQVGAPFKSSNWCSSCPRTAAAAPRRSLAVSASPSAGSHC